MGNEIKINHHFNRDICLAIYFSRPTSDRFQMCVCVCVSYVKMELMNNNAEVRGDLSYDLSFS